MYTRKHFIESARHIREAWEHAHENGDNPTEVRLLKHLEDSLVAEFSKSNPRFDEARWRAACTPVSHLEVPGESMANRNW